MHDDEIAEWIAGAERQLLRSAGRPTVTRRPADPGHAAGYGLLAYTGWGADLPRDDGPLIKDARTGETVAYAPIRDRLAVYSDNSRLTVQGFLDEQTVLLLVAPTDFKTMRLGNETWHLVGWDFRADTYQRLSSGGTRMRGIAVAPGLVR